MTRLEYLQQQAAYVNLYVDKRSERDGSPTKYRFMLGKEPRDYFADFGIFTAHGYHEATVFLDGFRCGYHHHKYSESEDE